MNQGLSVRGAQVAESSIRADMDVYFEAVQNLYHRETNPLGTFPLNIAENKLAWPILKQKIQQISREKEIPDWVPLYTSGKGAPSFRQVAARFFSQFIAHCELDPERLVFSAGATSVIEMSALLLGDIGDVVAIPAPAYPVYKQDIENIAQMTRYDIVTHYDIADIKNGVLLDIEHLDKAKRAIEKQGKHFRMLILTTPDNPTGALFPYQKLSAISDWCMTHRVHLVVNEIYGLSLLDTSHPDIQNDYAEAEPFVSFLKLMKQRKSDYLHWWYSFSKDFGISGFRVGCAYSYNERFIMAYDKINSSHQVSNYTQWLLEEILSDTDFISTYIQTNQKRLTESYSVVVNTLRTLDIEYVPARGSLFIWFDLSQCLRENTQEAENEFWLRFYTETGIVLIPGEGFGHTKKGLFRMVYSCIAKDELEVAMQRMACFVTNAA